MHAKQAFPWRLGVLCDVLIAKGIIEALCSFVGWVNMQCKDVNIGILLCQRFAASNKLACNSQPARKQHTVSVDLRAYKHPEIALEIDPIDYEAVTGIAMDPVTVSGHPGPSSNMSCVPPVAG
jgi:hypothetical protein